ncbi:MAG: hypothetical protein MMC33_002196 [Icmadophila ericetorum]|nr:hypothetical protein [Icmadophila ericetorum]
MSQKEKRRKLVRPKELLTGINPTVRQAVIQAWEWGTVELDAVVSWVNLEHDLGVDCWSAFRVVCYHLKRHPTHKLYRRLRTCETKVLDDLLLAVHRKLLENHGFPAQMTANHPSETRKQSVSIIESEVTMKGESTGSLQPSTEGNFKGNDTVEIDEQAEETFMLRQVARIIEKDLFSSMKPAVDKDDLDDCKKVAKKYGIEIALGL